MPFVQIRMGLIASEQQQQPPSKYAANTILVHLCINLNQRFLHQLLSSPLGNVQAFENIDF